VENLASKESILGSLWGGLIWSKRI